MVQWGLLIMSKCVVRSINSNKNKLNSKIIFILILLQMRTKKLVEIKKIISRT